MLDASQRNLRGGGPAGQSAALRQLEQLTAAAALGSVFNLPRSHLGRFHARFPAKMLEIGTTIPALFAGNLARNRLELLGREIEDTPYLQSPSSEAIHSRSSPTASSCTRLRPSGGIWTFESVLFTRHM